MTIETIFLNLPELETERLLLRKITAGDAAAIYAYGSDAEVAKYVMWDRHETLADSEGFVQFVLQKYAMGDVAPWGIVYKETGALIGTIDFVSWQPAQRVAEIGYVVSRDYWGQGIVTEAAAKLVEFGFTQMDVVRIQARCFAQNIGSARVMEKVGMSYEGTMRQSIFSKGAHQDVKMYAILRDDYEERGGK